MTIARQSLFGMPNRREVTALPKFVALTVMAGGLAAPASAVVYLPPATFTGYISYGTHEDLLGPGAVSHTGVQSASASAFTLPQIRAEVTGSTGAAFYNVRASARIQYSFFIFAPINSSAHVSIDAGAGAGGSGASYITDAYVALLGGNNTQILEAAHACANTSACFGTTPASTRSWNLSVFTNQVYTFDLNVYGMTNSPNTSFDVWADPTVTFNPNFVKPAGANLRINTSLTGTASIPEPGSWALLTAGFGGLGAMARRRRMLCVAS